MMKPDTVDITEHIKPLTAEDLEAVIAIDRAASGYSRRGFFEKRLAAALEQPGDFVYVGMYDGADLIGYALAKMVDGEFGKPGAYASLDALGVDRSWQGKCVGQQLLDVVVNILKHKGVGALTSQVDWSNQPLVGFLAQAGFGLSKIRLLNRNTSALPNPQLSPPPFDEKFIEIDHSSPDGDDPDAFSKEEVLVRSMNKKDLAEIIKIDRKITGVDRSAYFRRKQYEVLHQSGVRNSLIAELDGYPVGFIMARVDYGEFGRASPVAVLDAIGVDPGYQQRGVGQTLMRNLLTNLSILKVEIVRTEVEWNNLSMIAYMDAAGFTPAQTIGLYRRF
jgi:ribosomal protein S18 acetylase RimI-like enzyme